jgi:hypothetical protein
VQVVGRHALELGGEYDGHDDAVDGHHLTEDDGDEVLGRYPRRFDTAPDDGRAGDEDAPGTVSGGARSWLECAPCGADDGQADAEADAHGRPRVGRDAQDCFADLWLSETRAQEGCYYIERFTGTGKEHICAGQPERRQDARSLQRPTTVRTATVPPAA